MKCVSCSVKMKPVVVFDIDGTLAEYHNYFTEFACQYWNIPQPMWWYDGQSAFHDYLGLSLDDYNQAKLAYRQGGMKRTMPLMDSRAPLVTRNLHNAGAEIWMATTRPYLRHDSIDPDTRFWLDRHSFHYDHLVFGEDKHEQILEIVGHQRIVAIIDDLPEVIDNAIGLLDTGRTQVDGVGLAPSKVVMRAIPSNSWATHTQVVTKIEAFEALCLHRIKEWYKKYEN